MFSYASFYSGHFFSQILTQSVTVPGVFCTELQVIVLIITEYFINYKKCQPKTLGLQILIITSPCFVKALKFVRSRLPYFVK